jgi:hypothetical protein
MRTVEIAVKKLSFPRMSAQISLMKEEREGQRGRIIS